MQDFMKNLEEKRLGLNKATSMGEAILSICHPDSITTIKHWNTIIRARFEEVRSDKNLNCGIRSLSRPLVRQISIKPNRIGLKCL